MRSPTITIIATIPSPTRLDDGSALGGVGAIIWLRDLYPPVQAAKVRSVESFTRIGVSTVDEYAVVSTTRELVYARI